MPDIPIKVFLDQIVDLVGMTVFPALGLGTIFSHLSSQKRKREKLEGSSKGE
jgi:hypothetical protein